jgi:hypothetical protein
MLDGKPVPNDVKGWNAIVVDEQSRGDEMVVLIAVRFSIRIPERLISGLGFFRIFQKDHQDSPNRVELVSSYLDPEDLTIPAENTEALQLLAQRESHRLFYFVRADSKNPRVLSIHGVSVVDLASIKYLVNAPGREYQECIYELEDRVYGFDGSQNPGSVGSRKIFHVLKSKPGLFLTMAICDCVVAVSTLGGHINFYCCASLKRVPCGIKPVCKCTKYHVAIAKKLRWCCASKTLYALYRKMRIDRHGIIWSGKSRTFIRAYEVNTKCIMDHIRPGCSSTSHTEHDNCPCTKNLFSIRGCTIVNLEVCCRVGKRSCSVVYVLVKNWANKYFLRAYTQGGSKLAATVALPFAVASESMAVSNPLKSKTKRCSCCRCGVFIPFSVPDSLIGPTVTKYSQPTGCLCLGEHYSESKSQDSACTSCSKHWSESDEW